jgi:hypothetical protein
MRSKSTKKFRPFLPDFSLRVSEDVQILRIRRVHWLAAVRATYFEKTQTANGDTPMLNSAGEKIDLLTQELEKADHVDLSNAMGTIGGGGGNTKRDRTSSLALTIASDSGVEHERLLSQHHELNHLTDSAKISTGSPVNSGRNTPVLSGKHRRQVFQSEIATSPTVSNESSSAKNRSLT